MKSAGVKEVTVGSDLCKKNLSPCIKWIFFCCCFLLSSPCAVSVGIGLASGADLLWEEFCLQIVKVHPYHKTGHVQISIENTLQEKSV